MLLPEVKSYSVGLMIAVCLGGKLLECSEEILLQILVTAVSALPPHTSTSVSFIGVSDCETNFKLKEGCFSGTFSLSCPLSM